MKPYDRLGVNLLATILAIFLATATAQEPTAEAPPNLDENCAAFQKLMTGATLIGSFTVTGKQVADDGDQLTEERYEIRKVKKLEQGDFWIIEARIQYGDHDITVPVPVEVKWAGKTPVITLDKVTLPGLGTFGARVLIHDTKYAGTWRHDAVGGHMFGRVEAVGSEESPGIADSK